jgi:transposase-like protein
VVPPIFKSREESWTQKTDFFQFLLMIKPQIITCNLIYRIGYNLQKMGSMAKLKSWFDVL